MVFQCNHLAASHALQLIRDSVGLVLLLYLCAPKNK